MSLLFCVSPVRHFSYLQSLIRAAVNDCRTLFPVAKLVSDQAVSIPSLVSTSSQGEVPGRAELIPIVTLPVIRGHDLGKAVEPLAPLLTDLNVPVAITKAEGIMSSRLWVPW